jgi:DHA1 family tetracycline resistance protein-like MFS transporter
MYKFNWDEKMVGISLGVIGLFVALVQGVLIRWVNPWLGNEKSIYAGFFLYSLGMLLFTFANQSWMMFIFLIPYCLGGIAGPALQAVISIQVPETEQGKIQGTLTSLMSASAIVGPPLMTGIFYYFTKEQTPFEFAGAPFLLASILMTISALMAYYSFRKNSLSSKR